MKSDSKSNTHVIRRGLAFLALMAGFWLPAAQGQCSNQIGPAVIKGKKFFDSVSGKYIPIKGINYYPRPNTGELSEGRSIDFFSSTYSHIWERDIEQFKALTVNTVRLYAVDPSLDHSAFMCALKSAGMYVIVELGASCLNCSIRSDVPPPDCYPGELKTRGEFIISTFSKYDNVLAFSAGNEIALFYASGKPAEYNAACQKQFLRDMRAYIQSCPNMRKIPMGVVTADVDREKNALYYNCRSDPNDELENAEWYGTNVYQHCDGTITDVDKLGGWLNLRGTFTNYNLSIPVVLTEFGCPNPSFPTIDGFEGQRDWLQVDALFSSSYAEVFAGGAVFEYSAEKTHIDESTDEPWPYKGWAPENHGIGYYSPVDCDDITIPCSYIGYPTFDALASKYASVDTSYVPSLDNYSPADKDVTECPEEFLPLSTYTWPSADVAGFGCPQGSFVCPDCQSASSPTATPATSSPGTPSPTASSPVSTPTSAPTEGISNVTETAIPSTEQSTVGPAVEPTLAPSSTRVPAPSSPPMPSLVTDTDSPTLAPTSEPPSLRPIGFAPTVPLKAVGSSAPVTYPWTAVLSAVSMLCLLFV